MRFPILRMRRLRQTPVLRAMVRQTSLEASDLVLPLFVCEGTRVRKAVSTMPGVFQLSVDGLLKEAEQAHQAGVVAVILFGIPGHKDERASGAYARNGIVQRAVRALKKALPTLVVITDVCLCEYMSHGHCGLVKQVRTGKSGEKKFEVLNDETLELLARTALSHAEAGADVVAPSDMMDGRVRAIRELLDARGHPHTPILSYAAKFASSFYGPFREAAESSPRFGDRKTYQMDYANAEEAIREVALDIEEGADMVMLKPALAYQDLLYRVKQKFSLPVAVFNVSGEFAMVKAAAGHGWLEERAVVLEILTGFKRAGADLILTYWARDAAGWLRG